MCCCGKPTKNGEQGYSWDGKSFSVRQPDRPELLEGDLLLFDEPGRCGGLDAHCHHFCLIVAHSQHILLVKNGSGNDRIPLSSWRSDLTLILTQMSSDARFWFLHSIFQTVRSQTIYATERITSKWASAFVSKRIKKRKKNGSYRVWIEDAVA